MNRLRPAINPQPRPFPRWGYVADVAIWLSLYAAFIAWMVSL